jgi:hypothetical protein
VYAWQFRTGFHHQMLLVKLAASARVDLHH